MGEKKIKIFIKVAIFRDHNRDSATSHRDFASVTNSKKVSSAKRILQAILSKDDSKQLNRFVETKKFFNEKRRKTRFVLVKRN